MKYTTINIRLKTPISNWIYYLSFLCGVKAVAFPNIAYSEVIIKKKLCPDARKDWEQEEKGTSEDEMVGLHHWLNGN